MSNEYRGAVSGKGYNLTHSVNYCEGYVAFVDILGFGALVEQADSAIETRETIYRALLRARETEPPVDTETGLKFHYFSDSIIVTVPRSLPGLWHLVLSIDELSKDLLLEDVWLRGGIAYGSFVDDNELTFGPGINKAYRLESTIARYPRIVIGRNALLHMDEYASDSQVAKELRRSRIRRDGSDGVAYVHYLLDYQAFNNSLSGRAREQEFDHELLKRGRTTRQSIQDRIETMVENPRVYEKAMWLANYWNETVSGVAESGLLQPVSLAAEFNAANPLPFRPSFD